MRFAAIFASLVLLTLMAYGYDAPLAPVRNLDCATKSAVRFSQGATTQGKAGGPTAFVKIIARGSDPKSPESKSCDVKAELHLYGLHRTERVMPLGHNADADFDVVDWSLQHNLILISSERWSHVLSAPYVIVYNVSNDTHRSIDVAALFAGEGWLQCSAIIETTGFTPDGRVVVNAGPGSRKNRPRDCAPGKSYWAISINARQLVQIPPDFQQKRYGKVVSPEYRPCKEDPGIVDSCFMIHGRAYYSNGTPSMRIWRVGTNRILGVLDPENEIIPDNLAKQLEGFGVEVYGDFEVCPFTKNKPGEMQMVCVESASHLVTKRY